MNTFSKISLWCLVLLGSLAAAPAQVTAELVLQQEHCLVGESINAEVRVTNRSGQTMHLGDDPNWLTFSIEGADGSVVTRIGVTPVLGEFDLESGQMATRRVNLEPYFLLDRVGRYRVQARVNIKAWDTVVAAPPATLDIIKGARLWTEKFGLLLPAGVSNRPPEVRRYSLEQANHGRGEIRLYLRITDASETRVMKVVPIGSMVSFSTPDHQIDRLSQLHILYQQGAQRYLYTVVSPDGEILLRQTHEITTSRPKLASDAEGNFKLIGGARRLRYDDLPAPVDPFLEPDTPAAQP